MKTGFSKICINPPYGAPIVGYYEERLTKGMLDDIFVRSVAFDDGEQKAVVIAIDICLISSEYYDRMKTAISDACEIDKDAIFITCSHTHTGPLVGKDIAGDTTSDPAYDAFLINCVRDSAIYALADLKETTIESAEGQAKNISFCRRYRMKDGSVATNPGVNNKDIDHALATPNETVKLVKLVRDGGNDIFMVNFGTHPDSVGGDYISADYMGFVCDIVERAVPNTNCIFLLGAQGDVNHVNVAPTKGESAISEIDFDSVPRSIRHAEHMGRVIAGAVLSVCSITEKLDDGKIAFASKRVDLPANQENDRLDEARHIWALHEAGRDDELPFKEMALTTAVAEAKRIISLENGPDSFPYYLSALKVGSLAFAGIGGEPFTEIGNRICAASPFAATVLCALTNTYGGYVPTTVAYSEGGYEARSSQFAPGSDDIVVNGMNELLKSLK